MLRMLLFVAMGIIVWRLVRIAIRSMQTPVGRRDGGPSAPHTSPKRGADAGNIQDAEFEDITDATPPGPPPKR